MIEVDPKKPEDILLPKSVDEKTPPAETIGSFGTELFVSNVAATRPTEKVSDIAAKDARFRRIFAVLLYLLFFTSVLLGPIMYGVGVYLEIRFPERFDSGELLEKASLLATSIIGTVAGVFGTVMGFYFGSDKK